MPEDQVEVAETNESETPVEDNQEAQADQEQSSEAEKTFTDSFGNKYTSEEFQSKFNEIQGSFTQKAQEASVYQRELDAIKKQSEADARQSVVEDDKLKDVPTDVKEAIISLVQPQIEKYLTQKEEIAAQKRNEEAFAKELGDLEKEFDGKNGKPKFDRNEVLKAMKDPSNRIFDPRAKFREMRNDVFNDLLVKEALTKQKGGMNTEDTSGDHSKPEPHTPKSWEESRKAALARFTS